MEKGLLIFDFDGTIVDTITDVGICFNEALRDCGLPTHPLKNFGRFAGGNLETVVSRLLPPNQVTEANITRVKTRYRELYLRSEKPNTRPYPGIWELLQSLKSEGFRLAVNSNKGQALLDDMVEKMFPEHFFDSVVGYLESRPSKPDPCGVEVIAQACGCGKKRAVYVGDGISDVRTAINAGIPCIFVTWGQGDKADIPPNADVMVVDTVEQLAGCLRQYSLERAVQQ